MRGKSTSTTFVGSISLTSYPTVVLILWNCSFAGTGKGTTVAELVSRLPRAVSWSNGDIFRCITLLAITWQQSGGGAFDSSAASMSSSKASSSKSSSSGLENASPTKSAASSSGARKSKPSNFASSLKKKTTGTLRSPSKAATGKAGGTSSSRRKGKSGGGTLVVDPAILSPENLDKMMAMIKFGNFKNGGYDVRVKGLEHDFLCGDVKNTTLKSAAVAANLPAVARASQGHVVKFAAAAVAALAQEGGRCVVLEGREATVNYVPTPHRFTLTMSDGLLIGKRRAAQLIAAAAQERRVKSSGSAGEMEEAEAAVKAALIAVAQ